MSNLEHMPEADAEKSVIGAIIMDPDSIVEAIERVKADHFADPFLGKAFEIAKDMLNRGVPANLVTLSSALVDAGYKNAPVDMLAISQWVVGNNIYPANVSVYADMVVRYSRIRDFMSAAPKKIAELMQHPELDPADILSGWLGEVETGQRRDDPGPRRFDDMMSDVSATMEGRRSGTIVNDQTVFPWKSLNDLIGGIKPGEVCVLSGRPGSGKALSLDTPIPTPDGWTTMGAIRVGDIVFDENGNQCNVTFATEVQHERDCFEVEFDDGTVIVADAEHLWLTSTRKDRKSAIQARAYDRNGRNPDAPSSVDQSHKRTYPSVVTTLEIASTLRVGKDQRLNHAVATPKPIVTDNIDLPIPPYTLGVWLGDGTALAGSITSMDDEAWSGIRADGFEIGEVTGHSGLANTCTVYGLVTLLRDIGVLGNKHIPDIYLRAGVDQRKTLLMALMDSDGYATKHGDAEFDSTREELARGVRELLSSLGVRSSITRSESWLNGTRHKDHWTVRFRPTFQCFSVARKASRIDATSPRRNNYLRYIRDVRPVPSVPVRCIQVDSPSHLYLAGETMIPTHNTLAGVQILGEASMSGTAVMFSSEMTYDAVIERMLASETGIPYAKIVKPTLLNEEEYDLVQSYMDGLSSLPIYIDDLSGITTDQIMARTQALQREGTISMLVFDYLELAGDDTGGTNQEARVSGIIRNLKHIARRLHIPVLVLSQLSREVERRNPPIPKLSDLRSSGMIEQVADKVIMLYRPQYYVQQGMLEPDASIENLIEFYVHKNRNGQSGKVQLHFEGPVFRISEIPDSGYQY